MTRLVKLLSGTWLKDGPPEHLRVLDLCTGTGCIPLLFHHEMFNSGEHSPRAATFIGADISPQALALAKQNKAIQLREQGTSFGGNTARMQSLRSMRFVQADVLADSPSLPEKHFDVLISNPPYISSSSFLRTTTASVRRYEPKLALVPAQHSAMEDGDAFYPRLLDIASQVQAKVLLFEVADLDQAKRVAEMVLQRAVWDGVEIWRDEPGVSGSKTGEDAVVVDGRDIGVRGEGNGRSVVAWTREGAKWLGR